MKTKLSLISLSLAMAASSAAHGKNPSYTVVANKQAVIDQSKQSNYEQSVQNATRFLAFAIQAWNPSLREVNVSAILKSNISKYGVNEGLIKPTLSLIDISFAAGRPEFGNLLNPMLNSVAPDIAATLNAKFGMALDYEGKSFTNVSQYSKGEIWTTMTRTLGENFYGKDQDSQSQSQSQSNMNTLTPDRFLSGTLMGKGSYFAYALSNQMNKMGIQNSADTDGTFGKKNVNAPMVPSDYSREGSDMRKPVGVSSTPMSGTDSGDLRNGDLPFKTDNRGLSSTPGRGNERDRDMRGPISRRDMSSYNTCEKECFHSILQSGAVGSYVGAKWGGGFGAPGKIVGRIVGGAIGVKVGYDECQASKACGGNGGEEKKSEPVKTPEKKSQPEEKPQSEPREPKTPKEPQDKPETAKDNPPETKKDDQPAKEPEDKGGEDKPEKEKDDKDDNAAQFGNNRGSSFQIPNFEREKIELQGGKLGKNGQNTPMPMPGNSWN